MKFRVHAVEIHPLHCDVEADSPEEAEALLREVWLADQWTEEDNCLVSGPVRCETPGYGLEIESDKTTELIPSDRRIGQDAREFYVREAVR